MKRAQGAIEFVLITTVMMLFFAVAFIGAQNTYTNVQQEQLERQVYGFFNTIETEIRVAHIQGDGYERDIHIPQTFSGVPFEIELRLNQSPNSSDELVLNIYDQEFFYFLQPPVNGTINHGDYTLYGGEEVQINETS